MIVISSIDFIIYYFCFLGFIFLLCILIDLIF